MVSRKIVLRFSRQVWDQPVVCYLSKDFDLTFNILKAEITPRDEGWLVLELIGSQGAYNKGVKYLKEKGIKVEPMSKDVVRNDLKCTSCGACTAVCPSGALSMDRETWAVVFDPQKCIGCERCMPVCPPRAMEIDF